MALTDAELTTQLNTLATSTSDNAKMTFKANASMNKALDPTYFGTGSSTKIVNALNSVYKKASDAGDTARSIFDQVNSVLDTATTEGAARVEEMREITGEQTIVGAVVSLAKEIENIPSGGEGSGGGLTVTILEEPSEEPVVCEHVYEDGKCTKCGEDEPIVEP